MSIRPAAAAAAIVDREEIAVPVETPVRGAIAAPVALAETADRAALAGTADGADRVGARAATAPTGSGASAVP